MLLGITANPFYHDIYLHETNNGEVLIYDYWPPSYQWKERKFSIDKIWNAANHSICRSPQAIAIRQKEKTASSMEPAVIDNIFEYPNCNYERIVDQFMLGSKYLVAPEGFEPTHNGVRVHRLTAWPWGNKNN